MWAAHQIFGSFVWNIFRTSKNWGKKIMWKKAEKPSNHIGWNTKDHIIAREKWERKQKQQKMVEESVDKQPFRMLCTFLVNLLLLRLLYSWDIRLLSSCSSYHIAFWYVYSRLRTFSLFNLCFFFLCLSKAYWLSPLYYHSALTVWKSWKSGTQRVNLFLKMKQAETKNFSDV